MNDALEKHLDRIIAGAERFAAGDKSDPFTFARALAHIKQGLCGACEAPEMVWYGDKVGGSQGENGHTMPSPCLRSASLLTAVSTSQLFIITWCDHEKRSQ